MGKKKQVYPYMYIGISAFVFLLIFLGIWFVGKEGLDQSPKPLSEHQIDTTISDQTIIADTFASSRDIDCVDTLCFDTCSAEGFTDKFCGIKCQTSKGCTQQGVRTTDTSLLTFDVQSVDDHASSTREVVLQMVLKDEYNMMQILEPYMAGKTDVQMYDRMQSRKAETAAAELQPYIKEINEYFQIAREAYDIISLDSLYETPPNAYLISFGNNADATHFLVDMEFLTAVQDCVDLTE